MRKSGTSDSHSLRSASGSTSVSSRPRPDHPAANARLSSPKKMRLNDALLFRPRTSAGSRSRASAFMAAVRVPQPDRPPARASAVMNTGSRNGAQTRWPLALARRSMARSGSTTSRRAPTCRTADPHRTGSSNPIRSERSRRDRAAGRSQCSSFNSATVERRARHRNRRGMAAADKRTRSRGWGPRRRPRRSCTELHCCGPSSSSPPSPEMRQRPPAASSIGTTACALAGQSKPSRDRCRRA